MSFVPPERNEFPNGNRRQTTFHTKGMDIFMNADFSYNFDSLSVSARRIVCNNMARCHSHDSYELYLLLDGERYLFADGVFYPARAGDIFLIPPEVDHRTLDAGKGRYFRLTANIQAATMPRSARVDTAYFVTPSEKNQRRLIAEARDIMEADYASRNAECVILSSVMKMLSILLSEEPKAASASIDSPSLARIVDILGYIDTHLTERLTLTALSEKFFISEFYLCRLFKDYTGRTIMDYITDQRLRKSQKLLRETEEKISAVAALSGFGSMSVFGSAFKARYGMTPREYRTAKRQNS